MTMNVLVDSSITVENCRFLLSEGQVSDDYVKTLSSLSDRERFDIAKHLLSEIELRHNKLRAKAGYYSNQLKVILSLLDSFQDYNGILYEDFRDFMSNGDLFVVTAYLIRNKSFPIAFLLNTSLLEPHKKNPYVNILEEYIRHAKIIRRPELVTYCKNLVPDSESMSDEMVLSVAGVTL